MNTEHAYLNHLFVLQSSLGRISIICLQDFNLLITGFHSSWVLGQTFLFFSVVSLHSLSDLYASTGAVGAHLRVGAMSTQYKQSICSTVSATG